MFPMKVAEGGGARAGCVWREGAHSRRPPRPAVGAPVRVPGMGGPRRTLSLFLIFVPVCLHGALSHEAGPAAPRKPFFERLRRLEEQVRVPRTWGR